MKIDEPKTPYAKRYDPAEDPDLLDESDIPMLDAGEIKVDELENDKKPFRAAPTSEIPELELGESQFTEAPRGRDGERRERAVSHSPGKQVVVKEEVVGEEGKRHVPGEEEGETDEAAEKHRKFEEMRRRHYEMKNVANLLG